MYVIDIVLAVLVIIIIYYLFFSEPQSNRKIIVDNYGTDIKQNKRKISAINKPKNISIESESIATMGGNIIFVEAQFHNDYRDTITAFNDLVPCQKSIFNPYNLPTQFSVVDENEVAQMANDFVRELNKIIIKDIPEYRNANTGWEEPIVDKKIKSGWDKHMEALGLPSSLYPDPAMNSKIKLITIDRVEKYETDTEIKYSVFMFIKKDNVSDQLIIKVNFIMELSDVNISRKFFENDDGEREITIEEIFMIGYLTHADRSVSKGDNIEDFYNFENMEHQNIIDDKTILKQLIGKYKDRAKEMKRFNGELINENIYEGLPPTILGFNSNKVNRSVEKNIMEPRKYI